MGYVFAAPPQPVVPVADSTDLFPVHRVYCVGRNYEEHAKEMGFSGREPPFFFAKPADAVLPVANGTTGEFPYPGQTSNLHHELEWVVAIGKRGRDIAAADALLVHLGLCGRARHDAPRPAGGDEEAGPSMGDRQGLRPCGADRADRAGEQDRHPHQGTHLADGQRRAAPGQRHREGHLERRRDDRASVEVLRARARRPDLHGHARGRGGRAARRPARGRRRRHRQARRSRSSDASQNSEHKNKGDRRQACSAQR